MWQNVLIDTWKDVCKEENFSYPFRYQRVHICFETIQYFEILVVMFAIETNEEHLFL